MKRGEKGDEIGREGTDKLVGVGGGERGGEGGGKGGQRRRGEIGGGEEQGRQKSGMEGEGGGRPIYDEQVLGMAGGEKGTGTSRTYKSGNQTKIRVHSAWPSGRPCHQGPVLGGNRPAQGVIGWGKGEVYVGGCAKI